MRINGPCRDRARAASAWQSPPPMREQVHRLRHTVDGVAERAVERSGACRTRPREVVREAQLFVVEEVERLAAAVVHAGDLDWAAHAHAVLIQLGLVLRQRPCCSRLVGPIVRVESGCRKYS